MSSNFACEAVQRSAGANPQYLYVPAPTGNIEQTPDGQTFTVDISSGVAYDISFAVVFPANGLYFVSASCVTPGSGAYTVSGVFNYTDASSGIIVTGNAKNIVNVTPSLTFSQIAQGAGPTLALLQTSGGDLAFDVQAERISSVL